MMMNSLYNFMYKTWNVLYTNISFFFKEVYEFVDYLTYIQFNHLYNEILEYPYDVDPPVTSSLASSKIEYEDKYKSELLKYSEFLRKNTDIIDQEKWKYLTHNILMENTPLGNVILYYEPIKDSFCYYSDRILPYKYIDTVCRKYVIRFNCVELYFDINNNTDNLLIKNETIRTTTTTDTTTPTTTTKDTNMNKNNNIFVKLKSYNKSNKPYGNSSVSSVNNVNKDRPEFNRHINRYTYEGKLMNFNMLQKPPQKKWSYLDFKKTVSNANTN